MYELICGTEALKVMYFYIFTFSAIVLLDKLTHRIPFFVKNIIKMVI